MILQFDNSRSRTANITKAAMQNLCWEVIPHPPYFPDLAPSDFNFFHFMTTFEESPVFNYDVLLQNRFGEFFTFKSTNFFRHEIEKFPHRKQW